MEEKAFPGLHPSGLNGPKATRPIPLTLGEYIKNRINHTDRRFVQSAPWIFFSLYRLQYERLLSSINVSLKKATVENTYGERINDVSTLNPYLT